jgi:hypothetical protein
MLPSADVVKLRTSLGIVAATMTTSPRNLTKKRKRKRKDDSPRSAATAREMRFNRIFWKFTSLTHYSEVKRIP